MDGSTAVAANLNGNQVQLVDVSNAGQPVPRGKLSIPISNCGAVAIRGNRVAVGEQLAPRVAMLDVSDLDHPQLLGAPFATSIQSGFNSLAFLDANVVVGSGPNSFQIVKVDFSNPTRPGQNILQSPGLPQAPTLDADSTLHLVVAGSVGGPIVKLFDQNLQELASADSMLPGIASVALAGRVALVNAQLTNQASIIDFRPVSGGLPPRISGPFNNMLGASTVAFDGQFGAFGSQSGVPGLSLFDLSGAQPKLLGTLNNVGIGAIMSMSMRTLATLLQADIAVSPTALAFGSVQVNTASSLPLQIRNPGTAPLNVGAFQVSDPHFTLAAPANLTVQPGAAAPPITVTVRPTAGGPINATLSMSTNVPRSPRLTVPLSGTGIVPAPAIAVDPPTLDFGAVGILNGPTRTLQVRNTGQAPLDLGAFQTTDPAHFQLVGAPANLVLQPAGSAPLTVRFTPNAAGPLTGNLTMTTNVPGLPTLSVPLTGTGLVAQGTIQGHVKDAVGHPIADATVLVGSTQLVTDADGFYTLQVDPGVYSVTAVQSGLVPSRDTVTVPALTTVTKDFVLTLALPFTITGTIADAAGAPVVGATLRLTENAAVPGIITTNTDAAGHYTVTLNPGSFDGDYTLDVHAVGFVAGSRDIASISNGAALVEDFTLLRQGALSGRVLQQNGAAVGGATVAIGAVQTFSDATGAYSLMVDPGAFTATAVAPGFTPLSLAVVIPSGVTVKQDFVLSHTVTGAIAGTVSDDGGSPLANARVAAAAAQVQTEADGTYTLANLQPGPTRVEASLGTRFTPETETVTVIAGQTVHQDFILVQKGSSLPRPM